MLPTSRLESFLPTSVPTRRGLEGIRRYVDAVRDGVRPPHPRALDTSAAFADGWTFTLADLAWTSAAGELTVELPLYVLDRVLRVGVWLQAAVGVQVTLHLERHRWPGVTAAAFLDLLDTATIADPVVDRPYAHTKTGTGAWVLEALGTPRVQPQFGLPADGVKVELGELWRLVVATGTAGVRVAGGELVTDHRGVS
jgi:hypothetical protein